MLIEIKSASTALQRRGLSEREVEVLIWVAHGKTNSDIGTILEISSRTVSKHLEHIYPKLGVESRTAAVVHLLELIHESQVVSHRLREELGNTG